MLPPPQLLSSCESCIPGGVKSPREQSIRCKDHNCDDDGGGGGRDSSGDGEAVVGTSACGELGEVAVALGLMVVVREGRGVEDPSAARVAVVIVFRVVMVRAAIILHSRSWGRGNYDFFRRDLSVPRKSSFPREGTKHGGYRPPPGPRHDPTFSNSLWPFVATWPNTGSIHRPVGNSHRPFCVAHGPLALGPSIL